jgi:hypothetical protein
MNNVNHASFHPSTNQPHKKPATITTKSFQARHGQVAHSGVGRERGAGEAAACAVCGGGGWVGGWIELLCVCFMYAYVCKCVLYIYLSIPSHLSHNSTRATKQLVTAVWEFEACDVAEKALCFYSDREIRRMVRADLCVYVSCVCFKFNPEILWMVRVFIYMYTYTCVCGLWQTHIRGFCFASHIYARVYVLYMYLGISTNSTWLV